MVTYTLMGYGFALSALLICLTNIIFTVMDGHTKKPQNRVYIMLLLILSINAFCELVNVKVGADDLASNTAYQITRATKYIYFLSHSLIAPLFFYYVSFVVGRSFSIGFLRKNKRSVANLLWNTVPGIIVLITEIIIALNPLTHWCWYFGSDRSFHRGWGEYVFLYILSGIWVLGAFILVMLSWNILSKTRKYSISICFLLAISGIVVQLLSSTYRIEILLEAISFSGVLLFIENEDDRKNVELDAYNSAAFSLDMTAAFKNHIPVHILIIREINFNSTANTVVSGKINRFDLSKTVSEYLGTVVNRHLIYSIGHGRFALTLFDSSYENAHRIAQTICTRFQNPWYIGGSDKILSAKVILVRVPERAKTIEELLYIAECPIPDHMQDQIIEGRALNWIIRRAALENAITNGLKQGSFEVYYQPTYHLDGSLHGAEALLRMWDKDMGEIYPDEFIPIAEQLGMIDLLDEFVLKEVCKFILTGIPQKYQMDCINVNLSVLECMKEGFAEYVSGLVDAVGVRKKLINFEITESVAASDYSHLATVIDQLKEEGFQFSIDDYGTGYSNMTSLFSLSADIIKIDKSILWNAEKSALGMTLLKTSIEMVRQMQKKSLMEGVETAAQIEILRELKCDYLQGFFFSKPLPKEDFLQLLSDSPAACVPALETNA